MDMKTFKNGSTAKTQGHNQRLKDEKVLTRYKSLWRKFTIIVLAVGAALFSIYFVTSFHTQRFVNESQALAEARILSREALASWTYIDSIQDIINYSDGEYNFKGVYCSVASKSIAELFSKDSDYTIRYVRKNPRNPLTDLPDDFEKEALTLFKAGSSAEHYSMATENGVSTFRYVAKLTIEENCLDCHGDPIGTKDVTGGYREGMHLGDVAGAISIVIPMTSANQATFGSLAGMLAFFIVLMITVIIILMFALKRSVTDPLFNENVQLHDESEAQLRFLATISHELRTPLTSIVSFSELWKRSSKNESEEVRELVEQVEGSSHILLNMVNNTLDIARLDAGAMKLTDDDVDMFDVAMRTKATMGPIAKKHGVNLSFKVDESVPVLRVDPEALRRILVNLISNAVRFTDKDGNIEVSVSFMADTVSAVIREGLLTMQVCDDGCGIEPERQEHIFNRFDTSSDRAYGQGGTGLGLSLVKELVSMMNGSIALESAPGQGSIFTVSVPVQVCDIPDEGDTKES